MTYLSPYPLKRRLDHDGPALCGVAPRAALASYASVGQPLPAKTGTECSAGAGLQTGAGSWPPQAPLLALQMFGISRADPSSTLVADRSLAPRSQLHVGRVREETKPREPSPMRLAVCLIFAGSPGRGCWRGYFSTPRIAPPHAVQSSSFAAVSTTGVQLAGCGSHRCAPSISVPTLWPTSLSLWCVATPTLSIAAANMVMLLRVSSGCWINTHPALLRGLFRSLCNFFGPCAKS